MHDLNFTGKSDEALSRDGKIAVTSSVIIAAGMSTLFFIVGCLCGHFHQKVRKPAETVLPAVGQTQMPYYDDVVLKQELELKANVAYGLIQ